MCKSGGFPKIIPHKAKALGRSRPLWGGSTGDPARLACENTYRQVNSCDIQIKYI